MTTTARPVPGPPRVRTPRVLLVAGACVATVVAVATGVGALVDGAPGALGALLGGLIALVLFLFGSGVVIAATRAVPHAAMLFAVMTFALQVALVALVFTAVGGSAWFAEHVSDGWLAGGVIVAALTWIVGHMFASAKARVPVYDIDLPGAPQAASERHEAGAP